ncbi:MAG TPA: hypothetical protein VGG44_12105 [Tepidisphaeraceae bacterium]|jgi:hypothetical protein
MQRNVPDNDCWVDLFDADYFMGRRRRLQGPKKLRQLHARSLIVGPKASVVVTVYRGKRKSLVRLNPKKVVPDLAESLGKAAFGQLVVEAVQ